MCLKMSLRTDKVVVSVHPCVIGCVRETVLAGDENTRRRRQACRIQHADAEPSHGFQIMLLSRDEPILCARQNFLSPQRSITSAIRDEGNSFSVG